MICGQYGHSDPCLRRLEYHWGTTVAPTSADCDIVALFSQVVPLIQFAYMIRVRPQEIGHGLKLPFQFEGLIFTG
jgi:hypothetical protein